MLETRRSRNKKNYRKPAGRNKKNTGNRRAGRNKKNTGNRQVGSKKESVKYNGNKDTKN